MTHSHRIVFFALLGIVPGVSLLPAVARAGVPECRDLRLEDVASGGCELQGGASCEGSCSRLGIYKKACATRLHHVCRDECTISPESTCTDSCTQSCTSDCDLGVNITCIHNCFGECVGSCDGQCEGAADPTQCRATCEATCDGECDIQCRPIVDGDCYTHCIECCDGSCQAQANLDCQTVCQDEEFETCEHELEVECSGSCDIDVSLFCEGQYVLSGPDLEACASALVAKGTLEVSAGAQATLNGGSLDTATNAGCALVGYQASSRAGLGAAGFAAALALLGVRRRRVRG